MQHIIEIPGSKLLEAMKYPFIITNIPEDAKFVGVTLIHPTVTNPDPIIRIGFTSNIGDPDDVGEDGYIRLRFDPVSLGRLVGNQASQLLVDAAAIECSRNPDGDSEQPLRLHKDSTPEVEDPSSRIAIHGHDASDLSGPSEGR